MATVEFNLLGAFEAHSVREIRAILDAGFDVRAPIKGKSVVNSLLEMYTRSDGFPDAQLGLLPQMHRIDRDVYANITRLLAASGRTVPPLDNVPNRYLEPGR